jgi:CTP-dependent riboflavin kinase
MKQELVDAILLDPGMGPEHKAVLLYIIRFGYTVQEFEERMQCGAEKRGRILRELEHMGHLTRKRVSGGKVAGWQHIPHYTDSGVSALSD